MLVVSLKCEGGSSNEYSSLLSASLQQTQYHPYIISSYTNKLTLGDCRGKILFLHRDEVGPNYHGARCEDWQDDASCLLNLRAPDGVISTVYLQDEYQYLSGDIAELKKRKKLLSIILNRCLVQLSTLLRGEFLSSVLQVCLMVRPIFCKPPQSFYRRLSYKSPTALLWHYTY